MGHKCYISFKMEDKNFKKYIQKKLNIDMIDKSLDEDIDSTDEEYIMQKIREDYLSGSTVTIFLIGSHSSENLGLKEQKYIKRELQATLYDGENNSKGGILGVVLPNMYDRIYLGSSPCNRCGNSHNIVAINDNTVVKEFSYNYYLPNGGKCCWSYDECYCVLVKWDDFIKNPEKYIDEAYQKREAPISSKTKVYLDK